MVVAAVPTQALVPMEVAVVERRVVVVRRAVGLVGQLTPARRRPQRSAVVLVRARAGAVSGVGLRVA